MYLEKVLEFHEKFKHPVLKRPTIIDDNRSKLRYDLIFEELKELSEAINDKDLVGIADALGDLQYVLSGAILEFGFTNNFDKIFNEIHRSNMSKLCKTVEEAEATIKKYYLDGVEAYYEKDGEYYHVKRTSDHKTLKSINYSPADLKQFIEK
jgi:predicted HAD superfamily Cof-like phosphohydrolase